MARSDERVRPATGQVRARIVAATFAVGFALGAAGPAHALNPQPEPPGAQVVTNVARTLYPVLPPNPCRRLPNLSFADNPVLPPNPCFGDARGR